MARPRNKGKASSTVLATNRAARHEYHLLDRFEAGIVLTGSEVKSARAGGVSLKEAYARIERGEVFLHGAHISPYTHAGPDEREPVRPRKLLLHAGEIRKLSKAVEKSGMTVVPTRMYLEGAWIKVEIALARGKKLHDKRDSKRRREMEREIERHDRR